MMSLAAKPVRRPYRWAVAWWHDAFSTTDSRVQLPSADVHEIFDALREDPIPGPVLSTWDVTDYGRDGFVADPFLWEDESDDLHLFVEVFSPSREPTAAIGHAVSTDRGRSWSYTGIVLELERHASYPYVFEADDEIYMIPGLASEPGSPAPAKLYRATSFPSEWELANVIIDDGRPSVDTTVFEHDGRWWAIVGSWNNDELRVYHSERLLEDDWASHQDNPVVEGRADAGRPGGRPIRADGRLFVPYQDCEQQYGDGLRIYEVTELTVDSYRDAPLVDERTLGGHGERSWNSGRMHHLDLQVDGEHALCVMDGDVGRGRNILSGSMWSVSFGASE